MPKKLVAMVPVEIKAWKKSPGVWMAEAEHGGTWYMVCGLYPQHRTRLDALSALYARLGIKPEDVKEQEE